MDDRNAAVEYVEYDDSYAARVAKMWRESGEGWNGSISNETDETVRATEATSPHLKLWLAVARAAEGDGEVIGYCKLETYPYDRDTMFIHLLNVHPAWHGRGIGKELVLRCVRETLARGVPRLDLFTWAGNTKAVPLYKRCGFFWDNETRHTHLMNFLPGLLQSGLGAKLLDGIDWYADSTRAIAVEPDCRKGSDALLYEYSWEKDGRVVKARYEHYGRGLVALETENWRVALEAAYGRTVFGIRHPFALSVETKRGSSLRIEAEGLVEGLVSTAFSFSGDVTGARTIPGEYEVAAIEREQDSARACPRLALRVKIDGEAIVFGLGRRVSFPATLALSRPPFLASPGIDPGIHLSARNNLDGRARFDFALSASDCLSIAPEPLSIELDPGERGSVKIPATLVRGGFWSAGADVRHSCGGATGTWKRALGVALPAPGGAYSGSLDDARVIGAGKAFVKVELGVELNAARFGLVAGIPLGEFDAPRIGMPYSQEFSSALPARIEDRAAGGIASLRLEYSSGEKGTRFARDFEVCADGTISFRHAILDRGPGIATRLGTDFYSGASEYHVPYDGAIVIGSVDDDVPWKNELIDERWLAFRDDKGALVCVSWGPGCRFEIMGWRIGFEWDLEALARDASGTSGEIRLHLGTFDTVDEFRRAVLGATGRRGTVRGLRAVRTGSGAFARPGDRFGIAATLASTRSPVTLEGRGDRGGAYRETWSPITGERETAGNEGGAASELLELELDTVSSGRRERRLVFRPSDGAVDSARDGKVFRVNNGEIAFALDPSFSSGLHSLVRGDLEWLHSDYPARGSKSWWSEWTGGLHGYTTSLMSHGVVTEPNEARFFEARDAGGRVWRGIESTIRVERDERQRGLVIRQRFSCLPGLALLRHDTSLENLRGECLPVVFMKILYARPGSFEGARLRYGDEWLRAGSPEAMRIQTRERLLSIGRDGLEERLYLHACDPGDLWMRGAVTNEDLFRVDTVREAWLAPGERASLGTDFLFFDSRDLRPGDTALLDAADHAFEPSP